ncbi:MAG: hypothetical protein AVDCRST_MAG37-1244, partial [uncultured Rubrobacteraceae bacterium]
ERRDQRIQRELADDRRQGFTIHQTRTLERGCVPVAAPALHRHGMAPRFRREDRGPRLARRHDPRRLPRREARRGTRSLPVLPHSHHRRLPAQRLCPQLDHGDRPAADGGRDPGRAVHQRRAARGAVYEPQLHTGRRPQPQRVLLRDPGGAVHRRHRGHHRRGRPTWPAHQNPAVCREGGYKKLALPQQRTGPPGVNDPLVQSRHVQPGARTNLRPGVERGRPGDATDRAVHVEQPPSVHLLPAPAAARERQYIV